LSSELFLSTHAIIAPHPNLLLVASGNVLLEYDQGIRDFAALPEKTRQALLKNVQITQDFRDDVAKAVLEQQSSSCFCSWLVSCLRLDPVLEVPRSAEGDTENLPQED
jgi:hypothetical protein